MVVNSNKVPVTEAPATNFALAAFVIRLLRSIDFLAIPPGNVHQRSRMRISKSAAVLVGFFIIHSFPNVLLVNRKGRKQYSRYGSYHSNSATTKVVEAFLLGAGLTHGFLGTKKAFLRWYYPDKPHPHSHTREMMLTGGFILILLLVHLFDFRLNPNEDEVQLDKQVMEVLDQRRNRVKNTLYWLFVAGVFVHAWMGNTRSWLFRLGFRGREIPVLHRVCQAFLIASAALYSIPLLMENPYDNGPDSPVHGPRIISLD